MAIFNEILAGRFNRALQKVFSMKGPPPTPQLAGEIMPELRIDDMMSSEHRILLGVRHFGYSHLVGAGGAGTNASGRIRNPVGSNVIATIEKITIVESQGTNDQFILRGGPVGTVVDLTTADNANIAIRDARLGAISGAMSVSFGTPSGGFGTRIIWQGQALANSQIEVINYPNQEITLAPGDAYTITAGTANFAMTFSFMWRERALEESELLTQSVG